VLWDLSFIAIPTVTITAPRPDRAAYQSQFVSFGYANGVVRNLYVQPNFDCGQSTDEAPFLGSAYGYPTIETTANESFSIQTHVSTSTTRSSN
jgi:hypothetical protein